jgi:hypothetical protein
MRRKTTWYGPQTTPKPRIPHPKRPPLPPDPSQKPRIHPFKRPFGGLQLPKWPFGPRFGSRSPLLKPKGALLPSWPWSSARNTSRSRPQMPLLSVIRGGFTLPMPLKYVWGAIHGDPLAYSQLLEHRHGSPDAEFGQRRGTPTRPRALLHAINMPKHGHAQGYASGSHPVPIDMQQKLPQREQKARAGSPLPPPSRTHDVPCAHVSTRRNIRSARETSHVHTYASQEHRVITRCHPCTSCVHPRRITPHPRCTTSHPLHTAMHARRHAMHRRCVRMFGEGMVAARGGHAQAQLLLLPTRRRIPAMPVSHGVKSSWRACV